MGHDLPVVRFLLGVATMARTDILWAGRLDGPEGMPGTQAGLGPPDGQPFGLADRQVVTLAGWQRTAYSGLAELLGTAITGDAVSAEALATADVIAFEHNGGGPAHSGGWESCAWEFSDGQSTLAVPWNEATIGDVHLGTPVPRDRHVVANGSVTGAAYGAFFGIPAAVITQFQPELAPEQIVFSFLLFRLRDELDVTDPAFRVTIRGVPKVPGSQEAHPTRTPLACWCTRPLRRRTRCCAASCSSSAGWRRTPCSGTSTPARVRGPSRTCPC
jgi:hypothetical protein